MVFPTIPKAALADFEEALNRLVTHKIASRIAAEDPNCWGETARSEAEKRLGWVNCLTEAPELISRITSLRAQLNSAGISQVVLCGMGGSSLAPEVICTANEVSLTILDSSHPDMVASVLATDLASTVVVAASKSGTTLETASHLAAFHQAFISMGLDPKQHIVIVTDPETIFAKMAVENGYHLFLANPNLGGRYSALSAFGLVPSGLAGANLSQLFSEVSQVAQILTQDNQANPSLILGAFLGITESLSLNKLLLTASTELANLPDWVEQLIAESTGKQGRGILPVTNPTTSEVTPDAIIVTCGTTPKNHPAAKYHLNLDFPLGAQFLIWEYATAIAGHIIDINPFDQPDVEKAKQAARNFLTAPKTGVNANYVATGLEIYQPAAFVAKTPREAITELLTQIDPAAGYLSIHAYLDRFRDAELTALKPLLANRVNRPVTFGWGPRFLHSTGQFHKGGPRQGVFLQIVGGVEADLDIPNQDFSFGDFITAQAIGDAAVLTELGAPVLRISVSSPDHVNQLIELCHD